MGYSTAVKERAYELDPTCWISYSGKAKVFKSVMEVRRRQSLRRAQAEVGDMSVYAQMIGLDYAYATSHAGGWILEDVATGHKVLLSTEDLKKLIEIGV